MLQIGEKIPLFELPDQDGNLLRIQDYIGKKNLVIYFYPKDFTPGCTAEACSFRDSYVDFVDAGAEVFGISVDDPQTHKKFAAKYRLPFKLLSDADDKVSALFGVGKKLFILRGRVTFVVNKKGVLIHKFDSQINMEKHVTEALTTLKNS